MDTTLLLGVIGAVVGVAGAGLSFVGFRHRRVQEAPLIRIDTASYGADRRQDAEDATPVWIDVTLSNTGATLAENVDVAAWIYMIEEPTFTDPGDAALPAAQFTAHQSSIREGESVSLRALRSVRAYEEGGIPRFKPSAFPVLIVRVTYRGRVGGTLTERSVMASGPEGYEATGFDHTPA